jgi:NAD(P)-dependent dehydrogenase (short-subunit alcohol dehydrogenase family)
VLAVRNVKAAKNLLEEWQSGQEDLSSPLDVEVTELDLLSLDSVWKFGEAWETQKIPLHVLINNARIFCMNDMVPTRQPFVSVALCLPSHMLVLPCLLTKNYFFCKGGLHQNQQHIGLLDHQQLHCLVQFQDPLM